jgi:hypothetical protein
MLIRPRFYEIQHCVWPDLYYLATDDCQLSGVNRSYDGQFAQYTISQRSRGYCELQDFVAGAVCLLISDRSLLC